MHIVIIGAGATGSYLATRLSTEGQDVVLIEADPHRAAEVQEELDALVITGNGSSPTVLQQADIDRAELLIAVSNSDGANILACHIAAGLGVKRTIARVEDPGIREGMTGLGVDVIIDPGETAAHELLGLVRQGGVSEVVEFAQGRLVLVGGIVQPGAPMAGRRLFELRAEIAHIDWVVAAVVRNGETIVARGDTEIREFDHVLVMVTEDQIERAIDLMGMEKHRVERVLVLGGTRVAELTAELLSDEGYEVVIIDESSERCHELAEKHRKVLVVCGDPTDPSVLESLGVGEPDAVLALTGKDEVNIVGSLVARAVGASTTVSRVNRISYVGLLTGVGIDATVSTRITAANAILRFVRRGRIHAVVTFEDTDAEAIEIEAGPDSKGVDLSLEALDLPRGAVIGGVLRDDQAFVPTGATVIQPNDRLIFFALPEAIPELERLFS